MSEGLVLTPSINAGYIGMGFVESKYRPDGQITLRVPCFLKADGTPSSMFVQLGMVRKKNDGRWNWFSMPSKSFSNFEMVLGQGVAATKLDACKRVLENLPSTVDVSHVTYEGQRLKMLLSEMKEI